ncbi:unnamed protein product [Calicophoron daubneyi]|uniref:Lipocalin/cytosolic fatty-acid binding domain-containing protein n=1 Tax=Calicophoron daubneyi TaxID=300641 RepID=A0AAV2TWW9_CALDB
MAGLIGTWRCVSTENTEALLNEYGVEREKMEELLGKKQKLIISMPDSTHIHIRTEGDPHAIECAFDEEFEMHDPAGKIHKTIRVYRFFFVVYHEKRIGHVHICRRTYRTYGHPYDI